MISLATITPMARGLHLAATLSLLGTVAFIAWMIPAAIAVPDLLRGRLRRLWWISGIIAFLSGMTWFILQAAAIADVGSLSDLVDALPNVAAHTRYGNVMVARLGLLVPATALALSFPKRPAPRLAGPTALPDPARQDPRGRSAPASPVMATQRSRLVVYVALTLTIIALVLQGLIGHAGATAGAAGDSLLLSESLHLLAAGIWLGALPPLSVSLRTFDPISAASVCERFSPIGLACVLVLAGTGFVQGLQLIGSLPALFGTTYGQIAVLKITLFLLAVALAALNRLWLTDRLAAGRANARGYLLASVSVETLVGLSIVTAAAFMASSPPAAHTTPVWPFSWQFSLITVNEDPEFRQEVIVSLVAIGAAVALMVVALLWRRFRLPTLAILILALALRAPSLTLLTVQAYPTSFQTSPTHFSAVSIVHGQALFARNCVACHGPEARGDGPAAASLRVKPADLTMPHIWQHSDGQMFWWLTHGVDDPEGGLAMPGFGNKLSPNDRWALIDYVRAHNAGLAMQRDTAFKIPVPAPAFPLTCNGVAASTMADLRGHAIHLVAGTAAHPAIPPQSGISTVNVALRDVAAPAPGSCAAANAAAWSAFAVLADLPPDSLSGAGFLIDPGGWLRAVHRPGTAGGWPTPDDLIAAIRGICANPIRQPDGGQHEHQH